jgi:hypothetical protein
MREARMEQLMNRGAGTSRIGAALCAVALSALGAFPSPAASAEGQRVLERMQAVDAAMTAVHAASNLATSPWMPERGADPEAVLIRTGHLELQEVNLWHDPASILPAGRMPTTTRPGASSYGGATHRAFIGRNAGSGRNTLASHQPACDVPDAPDLLRRAGRRRELVNRYLLVTGRWLRNLEVTTEGPPDRSIRLEGAGTVSDLSGTWRLRSIQ